MRRYVFIVLFLLLLGIVFKLPVISVIARDSRISVPNLLKTPQVTFSIPSLSMPTISVSPPPWVSGPSPIRTAPVVSLPEVNIDPPPAANPVPPSNKFIVVLKDNTSDTDSAVNDLSFNQGIIPDQIYKGGIKGFSLALTDKTKEKIDRDPRVEFISEDREVHIEAQSTPSGISRIKAPLNPNKGTGIGVAVMDTGIDLSHPELSGSIVANKNCVSSFKNGNDDNGHGTHVAGIIAAKDNGIGVVGVAPQANLLAVKVLNSRGIGYWSQVICGLDWVTANASKYNIKVVNMSLSGYGKNDNNCGLKNRDALHKAVCKARDKGITIVVAAGNGSSNTSGYVPASYNDAVITVSALNDTDGQSGGLGPTSAYGGDDTFASFSNYGSAVDIGAPGVNILSTYYKGGYTILSGTSMAAPYVSGAVALYIKTHPGTSWTVVRDGLKSLPPAEGLNQGHTDPSGYHPESILQANNL